MITNRDISCLGQHCQRYESLPPRSPCFQLPSFRAPFFQPRCLYLPALVFFQLPLQALFPYFFQLSVPHSPSSCSTFFQPAFSSPSLFTLSRTASLQAEAIQKRQARLAKMREEQLAKRQLELEQRAATLRQSAQRQSQEEAASSNAPPPDAAAGSGAAATPATPAPAAAEASTSAAPLTLEERMAKLKQERSRLAAGKHLGKRRRSI